MSFTYFKNLQTLLKTEYDEDLRQYLQQTELSSVADKRSSGLVWYPIAIRATEIGRGDYLIVEVERTTHHDLPHQFKSGASAVFFSNHDPAHNRVEGTIGYLNNNTLKITLKADELPDWASDGKLGLELLFDNNSYEEMQNALKQADKLAEQSPRPRLLDALTGNEKPLFAPIAPVSTVALNEKQQEAVNKIVAAQDLAIVHGPPGTGKTTTLVQAIKAIVAQDGGQVLVVAPSNTAVDLLSEKLSEQGMNVLRIGNPARVSERLASLTLDAKITAHSSMKDTRKLKKQASEYINMAHKYKRNFGRAEREQRKALFDEAYKIQKEISKIEQYVIEDLVAGAQIITATLVGANHYSIRNKRYKTLVIDEAGQALEPACWIPILKADRVILAGDHCQLPPTIKSDEAAQKGLSNTLLEKLTGHYPEAVTLLEHQYRMHHKIMQYSSQVFYGSKLIAHESVAERLLFASDQPVLFIDTAGCGFSEDKEGASISNPEEASFLVKHLESLMQKITEKVSVAVISPYREQVKALKDFVAESEMLSPLNGSIAVNTIDSFQGQERDIVYISMTRSNPDQVIGFLADIRRMNVAMTRARKKLVVVGDSATLSRLPFYGDFIAYAEEIGSYHSAWEFMS